MKTKLMPLMLLLISQIGFARPHYEEAKTILENAPDHIKAVMSNAPHTYEFSSNFDGKDNVSFTGQTFRQVLINDLKIFMKTLKRGGYPGSANDAEAAMNSYFKFNSNAPFRGYGTVNGFGPHRLIFKDLNKNSIGVAEGSIYNEIQFPAKNLVSKMAGNDNPLKHGELKGWNTENFYGLNLRSIDADRKEDPFVEPEDLIQAIFKTVAKNAAIGSSFTVANGELSAQRIYDANITKDGVNLREITHKFLQGAVALSQVAKDYFSTDLGIKKGLNANNTDPYKGSTNYTALEHYWDEGFGYFGAARDFTTYTDDQIAKGLSKDSDGDGKISVLKEKNIGGVAANTARIDLIAATYGDGGLDLSGETINAFLVGRELINKRPEGYLKYVRANAAVAIGAWEKTLGAVVIHYLNSTLDMMDAYGTEHYLFSMHAKFWSEMKGYGLAFQFNPTSLLNIADFEKFHLLIGDHPVLMTASQADIDKYKRDLLKARSILRNAFGFSEINTEIF